MKSIEERADAYVGHPKEIDEFTSATIKRDAYIRGAKEQKAIDEAKLLKLKSAWEKEAQINHNDEANYKQGYHDAIEKTCEACKNKLQRLKTQLDESVGVPANLMSVDKSLSRIAKEMLYEDN